MWFVLLETNMNGTPGRNVYTKTYLLNQVNTFEKNSKVKKKKQKNKWITRQWNCGKPKDVCYVTISVFLLNIQAVQLLLNIFIV